MQIFACNEVGNHYPAMAGQPEGMRMGISESGIELVCFLNEPTPKEVSLFHAESDLLLTAGKMRDCLVMTAWFGRNRELSFDAPFTPHIGPPVCLQDVPDGAGYATNIYLFDEFGTLRHYRFASLSTKMSRYIRRSIAELAAAPFDEREYEKSVNWMFQRYTTHDLRKLAACSYKVGT